ncbi:MAG: hypothetical protein A2663_04365, partial [Candidatus Buchananbacteria bacterium RIFCSPHIGHO2_01_FULL_46_12]
MGLFDQKFDVAVIGGGPAGLLAAGTAAQSGAGVVLIEKNDRLGKKLLITGKGRCNLTNAVKDGRDFIKELGKNGPFLFSSLTAFGPHDVIDFFNRRGVKTKVERGGRVFPVSDNAADVLKALIGYINEGKVKLVKNAEILDLIKENNLLKKIKLPDGEISANNFIFATGGLAYPQTGSTGDGFGFAQKLGHAVIKPEPALAPVMAKEKWVKELEGLSLKNIRINLWQNNKKMAERFGEALFTAEGLSGPIILDLSQEIGRLLKIGPVELKINFKPALDYPTLDKRIQKDLAANKNKAFKNSLDELLPQKLIPVMIKLSGIEKNKKAGQLTRAERAKLAKLLTELKLNVADLAGFDKAIVTAGGIDLKEIDPKTMRSKIIPNLYFAGEIIDLNGPTGGFNL